MGVTMPSTATITQHAPSSISLQPHLAIINGRRKSSAYSTTSPSSVSTITLPSPSIVAARAYHLEHAAPSEGWGCGSQRRESLIEGRSPARGLSALDTSRKLTTQLENFTFASTAEGLTALNGHNEVDLKSEGIEVDSSQSKDKPISPSKRRNSSITPRAAEILSKVPFEYTHNHLREWGYAYLGNATAADVFVDAIPLRRDSTQEEDCSLHKLTTIRARVFPASKDRKPFLIQRDFDVEALRATIPSPTEYSRFPQHRRRSRSTSRRHSASPHSSKQARHKTSELEHLHRALPIREYLQFIYF